ncbi:MAG: type IV pilus secretin PilQ [Desulfohalobiaceae bacterium]
MIRSSALCIAIFTVLFLAGCATTTQKQDEDPFLDEWQELAEESRGHSPAPQEPKAQEPSTFTGLEDVQEPDPEHKLPRDKVSMKFRDDDLRVILRSLAAAAGQNIVMSNNVSGTMSIDLDDTPWNQAFRSVIATNGLTYSWQGDIVKVQSQEDMQRDKKLQQAQKESQPLQTTVVDIDYAHIVDKGVSDGNNDNVDQLEEKLQEILNNVSENGREGELFVDRENNALIIQATEEDTQRILHVFRHLERPRKQVHIEASIVEATQNTARKLGMSWRGRYVTSSGGMDDVGIIGDAQEPEDWGSVINTLPSDETDALGGLKLGTVAGNIAGNVLFSQLQALEKDGQVNILASPSLTTMDNQTASTQHGERVPYETIDEDGDRQVEFEDVAMGLEVLPRIIEGDLMAMDIIVTKDEVDFSQDVRGNPLIRTKETETNLLVRSGETIVISGLSKQTVSDTEHGVPGLRKLPGLSWLFKGMDKSEDMEEFIVFITPTILEEPGY